MSKYKEAIVDVLRKGIFCASQLNRSVMVLAPPGKTMDILKEGLEDKYVTVVGDTGMAHFIDGGYLRILPLMISGQSHEHFSNVILINPHEVAKNVVLEARGIPAILNGKLPIFEMVSVPEEKVEDEN